MDIKLHGAEEAPKPGLRDGVSIQGIDYDVEVGV